MGLLDKILYVADYIEARRYKAENLDEMRRLAFIDLDQALCRIMGGTLEYLEGKHAFIDHMTRRRMSITGRETLRPNTKWKGYRQLWSNYHQKR